MAILAIALTGLLPLGAQAAPPPDRSAAPQPYLVTLTAAPAATYQGGVAGMAATQAATGQRLQVQAAAVARYRTFLGAEQARVARSVGATPSADYTLALNGFAARLTPAQAARLAATPGVRSVTRSVRYHPAVYGTPDLLGLTGSGGVWAGLGGPAAAGKGVVVGVLDTGIWPENPMFAGPAVTATAPSGVGSSYRAPDGRIHVVKANGTEFVGSCQQGASFPASTCTSKLVGARFFDAGFLATVPADHLGAHEFLSPRDGDSHGSHTASTAAGDPVASMTVGGRTFQGGSGMAPAAKIAAYKVCWSADDPMFDGCVDTDIIAGIEAAIGDGVDVINFSLGGPAAGPGDPLLLALMNAAAAGVFVAAAGGNSGPGAATVDNASPWLTTVAATTAHRYDATVRLGNGRTYRGVQFATTDLPATPVVLGKSVAATGADPSDATQCLPDTLSPAKVAHRIVVCDRGITPRMEKANEVKRAGGAGMILANGADEGLIPDDYPLPAVHLSVADSTAVRAYVLGSRNPTAALLSGDRTGRAATPVPVVAGFSSRGPAKVGGGDLVKPDLAAPGVGIVAAVASDANPRGDSYGVESGTSMATPHIAGLAALIRGRHPEWTPMAVKSAMMTTATDTRTDTGGRQTDPFAQGAGFVNPRRFLTPGLVYDSNVSDWQAYLKGAGVDTGSGARPIAAVDLNVPSIGIGALVGSRTVTRTVTAVTAGTYTAAVSLPGFRVTVTPSTLVLARPGQRATFRVTLTRTTAPLDRYATGLLTWSARTGGLTVRSPIAVRPVPLAAPAELHAAATARSISYRITPGATGTVRISRAGLVAGTVKAGIVTVGPANPGRSGDAANKVFRITVPSGTTLTRFEARTAKPGQRLDLYLLDTVGNSIEDTTGSPTPGLLDRINPIDGTYYLVVNGASNPGGGPISFSLRVFNLGTARPTLTVTPNPVAARQGTPTAVRLNWPALRPRTPYLGTVTYSTSDLRTVITIG